MNFATLGIFFITPPNLVHRFNFLIDLTYRVKISREQGINLLL